MVKTEKIMYRAMGKQGWQNLQSDIRLNAGDLLYLPPEGTLFIKDRKSGTFGATALKFNSGQTQPFKSKLQPAPILIAITGNDAPAIFEKYFQQKGELSIREMAQLEQKGTFESRAVTKNDWRQIYKNVSKPENLPRPTVKELLIRNEKNFEAQHIGMEDEK